MDGTNGLTFFFRLPMVTDGDSLTGYNKFNLKFYGKSRALLKS